jgi:hypothetical protein
MKNRLSLIVLGIVCGLIVVCLPAAIKFFFRGILLLMKNPLEGAAFFTLLSIFSLTWIYMEEKIDAK